MAEPRTTAWRVTAIALLAAALAGCGSSEPPGSGAAPPSPVPECPAARVITQEGDLLGGSVVSRGQLGDFRLENDRIRTIIQKAGRDWIGGVNPYGGTIIDADIQRPDGSTTQVNFEASALGVNIETIPNYQDVMVLNDGANCDAAIIRATGPLDLFEYANPSSVIRDMGLVFPSSADDRPLPIEVQTDYILEQGSSHVRIETTLFNLGDEDLDIFMVEYLSGSGEVDAFLPGVGFGEPLATTACPLLKWVPCDAGLCDPCNFLAFAGYDGGAGVSYARAHPFFGSSSFNVTGINVIIYGIDVIPVVLGIGQPNFTVPGNGAFSFERQFIVAEGSVAAVQRERDRIYGFATGTVEGTVSDALGPVEDAMVAVYRDNLDLEVLAIDNPDVLALLQQLDPAAIGSLVGGNIVGNLFDGQLPDGLLGTVLAPALDVVSQDRTDAQGRYRFDLSPGTYTVEVFAEGRRAASPGPSTISVTQDGQVSQDFTLPRPGQLTVTVRDADGAPIPAKVQLVGIPPNPPRENRQSVLGLIETSAGVFFDQFVRDPLPFGVAFVDFVGRDGVLPPRDVAPGEYEVVVSRGPRYSAWRERVSVSEDAVAAVEARLARVVETPGFVASDFHVHAIDSLDARILRDDRILTYLGEGVDFFTPSDHGIQVDYQPFIEAMGVADLIGSAPSAEMTTFDYGHFNAWPRTVTEATRGLGYADWGFGDEVPAGQRFPEFGHFVKTPDALIAVAKDDPLLRPIVQINHIESHFGAAGLGIDTAQTPPQSTVDPIVRRLDPALDNLFSSSFDALEIWIGVDGRDGIGPTLRENMGDWFNLLNQGIVRTAVASSDTHTRRITAMSTRSMVASTITDPGQLAAHAQRLADTVQAGHVVMTNAPFLTVTAQAPSTGDSAGLGIEDARVLHSHDGRVDLRVEVRSPAWAAFDRIDLFINHAPAQTEDDPPRYTVCPDMRFQAGEDFDVERVTVRPDIAGAERLEATLNIALDDLEEDSWIVVQVAGTDGISEPLWPVEPQALARDGNDSLDALTGSQIGNAGITALAISNPLFVDLDGDGWQPPGVRLGECP